MTKAVFTIVSKNYLHFARTLMDSVRIVHPGWKQYVLIVDRIDQGFEPANEAFEVIDVAALSLPDRQAFYFRYTILELNTAVKPWMFEWLFQEGFDQAIYLDPDVYVYERMDEVEAALDAGAMMVLTPHLTGPLDENHRPNELDIVRAGSFNLGFLGVAKHPASAGFIAWWKSKLEFNCVVDHARGLFVDQKWLDLAPGMFDGVSVLRHEGYNVAYWNLAHRKVRGHGSRYLVNDVPLVFFHFSGLDPSNPEKLSKYQDRFDWSNLGVVRDLVLAYRDRVMANGYAIASRYDYAFGRFTNGATIPQCIRQLYGRDEEYRRRAGDNPFVMTVEYLNQEIAPAGACPITVLMKHVWTCRLDVQVAYPRIFHEDRRGFGTWFIETGAPEMAIPEPCIAPVRAYFATEHEAKDSERGSSRTGVQPTSMTLIEFMKLGDADFVAQAYRVLLDRSVDAAGLKHHLGLLHQGKRRVWILGGLRYSHEGRRVRATIAGLRLRYEVSRVVNVLSGFGKAGTEISTGGASIVESPPVTRTRHSSDQNANSAGRDWRTTAQKRFGRSDHVGFYDAEDQHFGLAWMGRSASVRLPAYQPGFLSISGSYDAGHIKRATGVCQTRFDVAINDRPIGAFVVANSGAFEATVALPDEEFDDPVFATLTAQHIFVPAALGITKDPRELSVRIGRIALNQRTIVDFGNVDGTYFAPTVTEAPGINIVGYVRSEHGIGESARLFANAALAAGIPFSLHDFNAGNSARTQDDTWRERIETVNAYPVNVFHINADQMNLARETLKEPFFHDRYNVGFWHWELPIFPNRFLSGFAHLHEIWVPTQFVLDAVSAKSPIPVVRMPHAIGFEVDPALTRQQMHLPQGKFLFLSMYDMHSAQGRKNPQAAIAAFRRAFPDPSDVGLVIKTQNTHSCPEEFQELKRELEGVPGIVLIDQTLSRREIYALEALCDGFVSLHRSEGFGLGLAECMYLGKPVIGTNWSGNVDFMTVGNSCPVDYQLIELKQDYGTYYKKGNTWADPDVDHAAWYMKTLIEEPAWRDLIAANGQKTIQTRFSPEVVGRLYRDRLILAAGF